MDAELAGMLRSSLARLLEEIGPADAVTFSARLDELGWAEIPAEDRPEAERILFETKGETLASVDALTSVLMTGLADAPPPVAGGCHVGLPVTLRAGPPTCRIVGPDLVVDAVTFSEPSALVVPVTAGSGAVRLASLKADDRLTRRRVAGLDPELGLWRIQGGVPAAEVTWADDARAEPAWDTAVAAGRRALAAELAAIAARMVNDAADYARSRQQYGRPVGSFQAVQHQLADAHVATVAARVAVAEATATPSSWTALVAKAIAGRSFDMAARTAQQVFGAIGFTWEHRLHRYLRRGMVLDAVLGDWRRLEAEIGSRLAEMGTLPRIGALWTDNGD